MAGPRPLSSMSLNADPAGVIAPPQFVRTFDYQIPSRFTAGPNYRLALDESGDLIHWRPIATNYQLHAMITSSLAPPAFYRLRVIDD